MTVEQIELRKILTQMLADNGIDRSTLPGIVKEALEEKITKAVHLALDGRDLQPQIDKAIDAQIRQVIDREVERRVRRILGMTTISITHRKDEPDATLKGE